MTALANNQLVVPQAVIDGVLNQDRIDEAPHNFYKYPARFSPVFAREAIRAFTKEGDTVVDCFQGGGTTVIEAVAMGRRAVGFDISSLAVFLARAKTTPLSIHDKRKISGWISEIECVEPVKTTSHFETMEEEAHYQRHLPSIPRAFFETILARIDQLPKERQRIFVRLVLLSVGQWALDCKTEVPSWSQLRDYFRNRLNSAIDEYFEFLDRVAANNNISRSRIPQMRRIINQSSERSGEDGRVPAKWLPAKLVLTSPPYPGVHVVYHRWQINGRKETPAPFWLANAQDGQGEAYYCLGNRKEPELKTYFERLKKAFSSVRRLVSEDSLVVQLVAFSQPEWQLPAYLQSMEAAGFAELQPICDDRYIFEQRIWRQVPGRKWYANQKGTIAASKEVLLLHRPVV